MTLLVGAIADDFTGATDLATNLVSSGYRTVVTLGVPSSSEIASFSADAVVVALKSRTAPIDDAVADTASAVNALSAAERLYVKYCSTFDSTPTGNIGPSIDSTLARSGSDRTIVVPAFPAAGRRVFNAVLFVNGVPLAESPMKSHPLTPMTDSNVVRLLEPQFSGAVTAISLDTVRRGSAHLRDAIDDAGVGGAAGTVAIVIDAIDNDDLRIIADASSHLRVVTGGSGLALGMQRTTDATTDTRVIPVHPGRRAILAGSASVATRGQVADAASSVPSHRLDLARASGDAYGYVAELVRWAVEAWESDPEEPVLVYSVGDAADISGDSAASLAVEELLGRLAVALADAGMTQVIVAGGETSGAVVTSLGIRSLAIGAQIAPGVAWSAGVRASGHGLNLALKSGNFGNVDMFTRAWDDLDRA